MAIFSAIVAAVSAISAWTIGGFAIGTALLQAAAGVGLNLLAQALAGKPEKPQFAVQGKLQSGGDVPRSFPVGYTATAGSLVYSNEWGSSSKTPNAYHVQVIALADLPISGLAEVWVNGEKVTLGAVEHAEYGFPVIEYQDDGKDFLWIKFYDGSQTVADPYLVEKFSNSERPYEATRVGTGVAYVVCTSRVHQELFTGFPQFKFAVNGIKLYDPSKDSTVGGNGAHRWNDRATWGGDGDHLPAVQVYNLLRGITFGGQWLYGLQNLPAARLPVAHWISQIAKCRFSNASTGNNPIYRSGGEIQVNAQIKEAISAMLTTCQGRLPEIGGTYKIHLGAPGAASFAFDDEEIVSTAEQSFTPFFGLADTINGIAAKYPSPAEGWNIKVAPPLYSAQFEAEDGKRRLMADVSLEFVPYDAQVQRLIKSALEEARRARRHTFVLPPEYWGIEPGDIVSWSSVRNGYAGKLFRVDGVVDDASLDVMVDLTEVDPSDYDWDQTVDFRTPTDGFVGKPYPPVQPMEGWAVAPDVVPDAAGTGRRPAIRINCAPDQDDVQKVHVQVRVKATEAVVFDSDATAYASPYSWLLSGMWTLPATMYQARGKFIPYSARKTEFSGWLDVLTPDIRLTVDDLVEDIRNDLDDLHEWVDADLLNKVEQTIADIIEVVEQVDLEEQERITGAIEASDRFRGLLDEIASVRDYVANADYAGYQAREEIRRTITARLEGAVASFDERITTAVSETAAVSERMTSFQAKVDDLGASITEVDTALVNGLEAFAQQLAILSVGTDNQFDYLRFWDFNTTVEAWTGNGSPTVASGFLRPANHASDPYVTSPTGLAVTANSYRQVRARVRKYGAPVWQGLCWWRAEVDVTWDVGRQATVAEPAFDANGIGLITFNMAWTGIIDQIRLDLSTAQTATDYYTIDWIAVGSPSPGASRAELAAERIARITGQEALASDIVALEAEITDPETGLTAIAGSVTALVSTVSTIGDTVNAHSLALTGIDAELEGKASVDAVTTLEAEVEALGGGGIVSQGSVITAIRNSLLDIAGEIADQDAANFLAQMAGLKALADASNSLDTKITANSEGLDILSQAVTRVQATIPGLASATALELLTSRVTLTENTLVSQSSSITSINSSLPLKANSSDVTAALATKASASGLIALTGRVTQTEEDIDSQADAITSLMVSVGQKVNLTAFNSLSVRVSDTEDGLDAQSDLISSLTTTVGTKASVSALNALTTRVTETEDGLTTKASASSLNALTATVDGISADARFKMEVVTGPSGYARIAARVRYGTSGSYRTAGWYTDVPANTDLDTLFVIEADRFAFIDGTSRLVPFRIDDGKVFVDELVVGTHNIEQGAITKVEITDFPNQVSFSGGGPDNISVTINHGTNSGVIKLVGQVDAAYGNIESIGTLTLWDVTGDAAIRSTQFIIPSGNRFAQGSIFWSFSPPSARAISTFSLRIAGSSGNGQVRNRYIEATQLKR